MSTKMALYWNRIGLKLPKYLCITRWGTWLNAEFYYKENYNKIKRSVLDLIDDSKALRDTKILLRKVKLQYKLSLYYYYRFLPEVMEKIQPTNLTSSQYSET